MECNQLHWRCRAHISAAKSFTTLGADFSNCAINTSGTRPAIRDFNIRPTKLCVINVQDSASPSACVVSYPMCPRTGVVILCPGPMAQALQLQLNVKVLEQRAILTDQNFAQSSVM